MSLIWLEIVLGFGVPLAWGLWELHTLRRDRRAAQKPAAPGPAGSPPTPTAPPPTPVPPPALGDTPAPPTRPPPT